MLTRIHRALILISICTLYGTSLLAQSEQIFLQRDFDYSYNAELTAKNVKSHTAIKPFLYSDLKTLGNDTDMYYSAGFPFNKMDMKDNDHAGSLTLLPLASMEVGFQSGDSSQSYSRLGVGASALFKYKEAITARVNFMAFKEELPGYLTDIAMEKRITPDGHVWDSHSDGFRYTDVNGYLSWNAGKYFNIQAGHGRNFIGSGYRSLLLSDHAGNYNYGKITANIWRIKYVVLYAHQKDINNTNSSQYSNWRNKYSTSHYLSWNIAKWLNVGVFESVVWKAKDTLLNRGYDINYLNPIIFFRPVEYSTGSSDNSLLGMNLEIKPMNKLGIYAQFMLDEFIFEEFMKDVKETFNPGSQEEFGWWGNKYGFQVGAKYFDAFGLPGLGLQTELNWVRPFTYSHADPTQNYGHQNASLAHPLGGNFFESVSFINYNVFNWFFQLQVAWYNQGLSTATTNYGENIYESYTERDNEYGHVIGQGVQKSVMNLGFRASYLIYPENNLRLFLGVRNRGVVLEGVKTSALYTEFGITTRLFNRYTDI